MRRNPILPLETADLKKMHTRSLLKRLEQLHHCEECFAASEMMPDEIPEGQIVFKQTSEWERAYHDVKAELATREHVSGGEERASKRNLQARRGNRGRCDR